MSKFVLIFDRDWADEFQCQQFKVFDSVEDAVEAVEELIAGGGYFGTNEGYEEGEIDEDDFEIREITDSEFSVLNDILGSEFGTGPIY